MAALKRWVQQHGAHLFHFLLTHRENTPRVGHFGWANRGNRFLGWWREGGITYQQDMVIDRSAGRREVRRHCGTQSLVRFCFHPAVSKHLDVMSQHTWRRETAQPRGSVCSKRGWLFHTEAVLKGLLNLVTTKLTKTACLQLLTCSCCARLNNKMLC